MKKSIMVSLLAGVLVAGSGVGYFFWDKHTKEVTAQQQAAYAENLRSAVVEMLGGSMLAGTMCELYSDVWNRAIEDDGVMVGDRYAFDFNTAITYQQELFESKGSLKDIDDNKKKVDDLLKNAKAPAEEYKPAYDAAVEMYQSYSELISQASSPSGSLIEFNKTKNELLSEINKKADEFKIKMPE